MKRKTTNPSLTSNSTTSTSEPTGGTKLGWSFWSMMATCWRKWFLKYVAGLTMDARKELVRGVIYHAIMEGVDAARIKSWGPEFFKGYDEAAELTAKRLDDGPPIPAPIAIETERRVPNANMTSRPDREEAPSEVNVTADWRRQEGETRARITNGGIRDFKTTNFESKNADLEWQVHGSLIGQLIATGNKLGTVDVMNAKTGKTKLYEVHLTPEKESALRGMLAELEAELDTRLYRAVHGADDANKVFPRNLTQCVGKYGPCDFYLHCWGTKVDQLKYGVKEPKFEWARAMGLLEVARGAREKLFLKNGVTAPK